MSNQFYEVISVREIGQTTVDEYVYDLETEDGTYLAGDDIVLKNTDSTYIAFDIDRSKYISDINNKFDEEAYMTEQFRISQEAAEYVSSHFKDPIRMEFEKTMMPFFLYAKKRYAYQEWIPKPIANGFEKPKPSKDLQYKGLSIVRRDFCPLIKEVCGNLFDILMKSYKNDPKYNENMSEIEAQNLAKELAISYVQEAIRNLLDNKVPIEKLIITKSLRDTYKIDGMGIKWSNGLCREHNFEKEKGFPCKNCKTCIKNSKECKKCQDNFAELTQPHVRIAQRLRLKDPLNGPKPPDRVPFLFVIPKLIQEKNIKLLKQCDITEHPNYIKDSGLKVDTLYYFEHQLKTPIKQIFDLITNSEVIYGDLIMLKNKQNPITKYFKTTIA